MPGNIARYTLLNRISGEEDFLWQNDYGQKMLITGIELPLSYEVHFANSSRGDSVPELGDSSGVLIPDTVLTSGKPVYFWLFLHVGENDGQTVYGGVINVKPRTALPTVEPPTPAQQSILDELMAAMNNAISHVDDVAEGIPTAIDTALEQAKQSGEFKGDTGAVFTPSVTGAGVISWTNDGGLPNPETVDLGQGFATKDEINGKLDRIEKGTAGGVAELDEAGKVPASQLPSFVDDVVEYPSLAQFPSTGESGKIYVSTSNNTAYRWSGTQYVPIGGSLTLGETSATAYRGDRGSAAFSHALLKGNAYAKGLYKIRTNAEGHVIEATAVTKQDIVNLGIPDTTNLEKIMTLQADVVPNTTQTIAFDQVTGNVQSIVHAGINNVIMRTDTFTYGENTITELRTLRTGEKLEIETNTTTLVTIVTYTAA